MAIYWPTPGYKGRTFKLCVLTKWDFNFCIRSSPLRGKDSTPGLIIYKLLEPVLARRRTEGFAPTSFRQPILYRCLKLKQKVFRMHRLQYSLFHRLHLLCIQTNLCWHQLRNIQYLGVIIDSKEMSVFLTTERADILQCCVSALKAEQISQTIG